MRSVFFKRNEIGKLYEVGKYFLFHILVSYFK